MLKSQCWFRLLYSTDVIMQNTSIQYVKSTQFLEDIMDNKLRWNDHITYVTNKISKSLGICLQN